MVLLLWGQRVLLGVLGPGRIDPQLPITSELPSSNQKTSVSLGWWLEAPKDKGEGLQQVALPRRAPAAAPIEVPRIVLFDFLPPTA
ncbi:hypothetical protein [Synechococcus sp. M16CYN]|uniref:hypothetical protein n=1 Tax=Synechococcus sp. M16CYN TaxID=3103139 RepID=UPI00333E1F8C